MPEPYRDNGTLPTEATVRAQLEAEEARLKAEAEIAQNPFDNDRTLAEALPVRVPGEELFDGEERPSPKPRKMPNRD
jgi:hypothetical protein